MGEHHQKYTKVDDALEEEIRSAGTPWASIGRCYGIAKSLAVLLDSSTDEELDRVVEDRGLKDLWARMCADANADFEFLRLARESKVNATKESR
jgi:hypothetical protein